MRRMKNSVYLHLFLFFFFVGEVAPQGSLRFTRDMNRLNVPENTRVGSSVYRLEARDANGGSAGVAYSINSNAFTVRNSLDGIVYLVRALDYESERQLQVEVVARRNGRTIRSASLVKVDDSNDLPPTFDKSSYSATVNEDANVGTTVLRNIAVSDRDSVGATLFMTCVSSGSGQDCSAFRVVRERAGRQFWTGTLILAKRLDYETRTRFTVPLRVSDGQSTTLMNVDVSVLPVQDTKPRFLGQLTAVISTDLKNGDAVLDVNAVDGDQGPNRRTVRFSLLKNPQEYFRIDAISGQIYANRDLARNSEAFQEGLARISVRATETDSNGQDVVNERGYATANVIFSTRTSNDFPPQFSSRRFEASINEDHLPGTEISGLNILIQDQDFGSNANFQLQLTDSRGRAQDNFEIRPKSGDRTTSAGIWLRPSAALDFDRGLRFHLLRIVARETQTAERRSSVAELNVTINDVNDNYPQFSQRRYHVTVSESVRVNSTITTVTATDIDSESRGQDGIRYRLAGEDANLFRIDGRSGVITVARCDTSGRGQCIDFERKQIYNLTVLAKDNYGEGLLNETALFVNVTDENDNQPVFINSTYVGHIVEEQVTPNPRLFVTARDPDRTGRIRYTIVGGNGGGLWQIHSDTAEVTATRPVPYPNIGYYNIKVQANDGTFRPTTTVRIYVIDVNTHTPRYPRNSYEKTIPEDTKPGIVVLSEVAVDDDPSSSANGQIRYHIASGSENKFSIDDTSGIVTTASATFDYATRNRYVMELHAVDQGSEPRTGTTTLTVNILDSTRNKPEFSRKNYEAVIFENASVSDTVLQFEVVGASPNARLEYEFINTPNVFDSNQQRINPDVANGMFVVDSGTGAVVVNAPLEYDRVHIFVSEVKVTDFNDFSRPDATTQVTITVKEIIDNAGPPQFPRPWTPQQPEFSISVDEERAVNSFVLQLNANDPDGIGTYVIEPNLYFVVSETGSVTQSGRLDFEQLERTSFVVRVSDRGSPPQTSTATVNVKIRNINDNTPVFTESQLNLALPENSAAGTTLHRVNASDADKGNFGEVRYRMDDPNFFIDDRTGVITVSPNARLDRETTSSIFTVVFVYDSPSSPSVRLNNSIQVSIRLNDVNDNAPRFEEDSYEASIIESTPAGTGILSISATDADEGRNSEVTYSLVGGTGLGVFRINSEGIISTTGTLTARNYTLTVQARDNGLTPLVTPSFVTINVIRINNLPPKWVHPLFQNETVNVTEDQFRGVLVERVMAEDPDGGNVVYNFFYNGNYTESTPEFTINKLTGQIKSNVVFDREVRETYVLQLSAQDDGFPRRRSSRILVVRIMDVDDNLPRFPSYRNCCTIDVSLHIREDAALQTIVVDNLTAVDVDTGPNAPLIRYRIVDGNFDNTFSINELTGVIRLRKQLDYEKLPAYQLRVEARSGNKTQQQKRSQCLCDDYNYVTVIVNVIDVNDNPPVFNSSSFGSCISVNAPIGEHVTTVRAGKTNSEVNYTIFRIRTRRVPEQGPPIEKANNNFGIGGNGRIISQTLMTFYEKHYFEVIVLATDLSNRSSVANVRIYVTEPDDIVRLTVTQPLEQVVARQESILRWIANITSGGVVCLQDVRAHVDENGIVDLGRTDMLFHVYNSSTNVVVPPGRVIDIIRANQGHGIDGILIPGAVSGTRGWAGFAAWPIWAAILALLFLLLLALLLLCWVCCCGSARRRKNSLTPLYIPTETVNPMWKSEFEDQELKMNLETGKVNTAYEADGTELHYQNNVLQQSGAASGMTSGMMTGMTSDMMSGMTSQTMREMTQERLVDNHIEALLSSGAAGATSGGASGPVSIGGYASERHAQSGRLLSSGAVSDFESHSGLHEDLPRAYLGTSGIGATLHATQSEAEVNGFTVMHDASNSGYQGETHWSATSPVDSAPPSYHSFDASSRGGERVLQDVHSNEQTDGLYQGEILFGSIGDQRSPSFPTLHEELPALSSVEHHNAEPLMMPLTTSMNEYSASHDATATGSRSTETRRFESHSQSSNVFYDDGVGMY